MRNVAEWLEEYGASHRNAVNEWLHFICVPLIVLSLLDLLRSLPVPAVFADMSSWLNWATLAVVVAVLYYFALAPRLAIGILVALAIMLLMVRQLALLSWPLWTSSLAIFVAAWIGQFIGHAVEGKQPSFFKDVQFLLIGPLRLMARLYRDRPT